MTETSGVRPTLTSPEIAKALGISQKLLLRLRKHPDGPFQLGRDYRFRGVSPAAPLQWFPEATDQAFTSWQQKQPHLIETMDGGEA
jgi:hypothetical protein